MKFLSGFREMPLSQKMAYKWLEHFHGGAELSEDNKKIRLSTDLNDRWKH
jgi:hypothetical protein